MSKLLTISPSPHIRGARSTQQIMALVISALLPAIIVSGIVFGLRAIFLIVFCGAVSVLTEFVCRKIMKKDNTITDCSALLTGIILALNLPATLPLWEAALGCIFAVAIVKQLFGGLGCNFANPAITGRIFLLLSFAGDMTTWVKPFYYKDITFAQGVFSATGSKTIDAVTSATMLAGGDGNLLNAFLGNIGGSLGETSALALLIGGIFLIIMGVITWHIPVSYLGSLALFELFYTLYHGEDLINVPLALVTGGVMLGAFFMATDYVTSPMTNKGKIIFGIGCGLITFVIREFASMPEGCSFSILLMNLLTPYINQFTLEKPFGGKKKEA